MLNLTDREWGEFSVVRYFDPKRGREGNMNALKIGKTPLVSAKNRDNGLKGFVDVPRNRIHDGHTLTLNNDGDGGAGYAYYQPSSFALDTHVTALRPVVELSKSALLFVSCAISKQREIYGHGYSISDKRLNALKIMLPIADDEEPDWMFMEQYIQEREQRLLLQYKSYVLEKYVLPTAQIVMPLEQADWHEFQLSDIFDIRPGKRLTKSDMKAGKCPFIGATEYGNGVTNWVSNTNSSLDKDVLGVNYNGSVVETFYHPYECIFSDDVKRFRLKDRQGNLFIYLFLKTAIIQQKSKYAYGYKFNEERMNKQSIILPVDERGNPDWAFMESCASAQGNVLLNEYKERILSIVGEDCSQFVHVERERAGRTDVGENLS